MAMTNPAAMQLDHQTEGTQFLCDNVSGALFDEQGLGKSKQVIDAITILIEQKVIDAALVICPNGLKTNWVREIEKFSCLRCSAFGSGRTQRSATFRILKASIYVINYEAVAAESASLKALLRFKRFALILDESHRIKTPDAKTTRAVLGLRTLAERRYILSGTPVANKPEDLWAQMMFLDDGQSLGRTFEQFRECYGSGREGYRNLDSLRNQLAGRSIRRLKEGTIALPGKHFRRIRVALSGIQARMYETMKEELVLWVRDPDGESIVANAESILARLVRLAQIASNPALIDAGYSGIPSKFLELDRLLSEYLADPAQKLIIWTSFVENVRALMLRYAQWNPVCIHGAVDVNERDHAVSLFKSDATTRILIANPAAAREGLTLTEANVAIYVDRTFNLVDYLQSQDRIHRISQQRDCEIVLLLARDTVDEFIDFALDQKRRLAQYAQSDTEHVAPEDALLAKPEALRQLIQTL